MKRERASSTPNPLQRFFVLNNVAKHSESRHRIASLRPQSADISVMTEYRAGAALCDVVSNIKSSFSSRHCPTIRNFLALTTPIVPGEGIVQ